MVTVSTKWDDPKKVVCRGFGDTPIYKNQHEKYTTVSAWLQLAKWCPSLCCQLSWDLLFIPGTLRFMVAMHGTGDKINQLAHPTN